MGVRKNTSQQARGLTAARKKVQARTRKSQSRFLREFAHCGNVLRSAQAANVGRRIVYTWRETEPFKTLYEEAHEDALDQLEDKARRRAVDGVLEPVVSAGKLVCHVRKYSDATRHTLSAVSLSREARRVTVDDADPLDRESRCRLGTWPPVYARA